MRSSEDHMVEPLQIKDARSRSRSRAGRCVAFAAAVAALTPVAAFATGLATCDSGPESGWKPQAELEKQLTEKGWKVNRIKVDGGCYEVYAIDGDGKRVEAYFHPVTLAPVPTRED
jgi:hypothetical protein